MSIRDEIALNRLISGRMEVEQGLSWFCGLCTTDQLSILRMLQRFSLEAGAFDGDVGAAISASCLKPTFTPCVLLKKGNIRVRLAQVVGLPVEEREKVFRLLVSLASIADHRRRASKCRNGCRHWWHRDLDDPDVVAAIVRDYEAGLL